MGGVTQNYTGISPYVSGSPTDFQNGLMNNRNRVVEEFREENLEYIRELEQKTDVMSGYLEATSDIASHLYEEHYMHDEDHLDLEDIEEERNVGVSLVDERGERIPFTSLERQVGNSLQDEARIAYVTLKYSRNMRTSIGSGVWIYYYTHSGILSEYPEYNIYNGFTDFQRRVGERSDYYARRGVDIDLISGEGNNLILHISIPVYYHERSMGMLSGNIKPVIRRSSSVDMHILDSQGKFLFSSSSKKAGEIERLFDNKRSNEILRRGGEYIWTSRLKGYDGLFCYTLSVLRVYYIAFKDSTILILIAFILYLSQRDINKRRETAREREVLIAQLVEVRKDLEERSEQDYLTKLLNRRGFLKRAETEYSRLKRHGGVFSLILCDIDLFKKFNDNYGHECGDMVLKEVSEMFRKSIRESDLAGRWGGEEFIFLLIESEGYPAYQRAESLRRAVEEHIFNYKEKELRITISFGVYQVNPDLSLEENINVADKALYLSKQSGRNRVEIIEESGG